MKLSMQWLGELVDLPDDVEAICERMTLLGLEVEEVVDFELTYPKVVVGHVVAAEKHPDADRLRVCRVNVGADELDIVCGAPNVRAGLKVAVATVGAVLPGGVKIKKGKIRGQVSMGMICSEKELGLGQGHEGILELPEDLEVGRPLDEVFGTRDTVVEIEVTPNRPDWLSHVGVARELAAHYGGRVRLPEFGPEVPVVKDDGGWSIQIDDPSGCRVFRGRLVDGVQVGPSPIWMRQRLLALGQRPINAVVDASNYVLHELGHPNHCFDRAKIDGRTIHVRSAKKGELFTTLDDVQRELEDFHLLVADASGGIALAGIMGGANSEVGESTRDLLLEVAVFDPRRIRRGRRAVGLSTDASYRFERGVDDGAVDLVSRRLTHLIGQCAGGTAHDVVIEARGDARPAAKPFFVRAPQVRRLLGVELEPQRMQAILEGLEISAVVKTVDGVEGVEVTSPSFRHDLFAEVDAIEEIARHHGFDQLPERARVPMVAPAARPRQERFRRSLRMQCAARGYHEVMGSAFMPDDEGERLGLPADDRRSRQVRVLNPVVAGEGTLRTTAVGELARIVERNRRRGFTDPVRLFQISRSFLAVEGEPLPDEVDQLVLAWAGPAQRLSADVPPRAVDLFDAIGELDALLASINVTATRRAGEPQPYHKPGSTVDFVVGDAVVGRLGVLSPAVARKLDVEVEVLVAEFGFDALVEASAGHARSRPLSVYPPVRRDLSLVTPRSVAWATIVETVESVLGDLCESCELFDVYEGDDLPDGTVALGVRLSLRSASGTLKDKKVDALIAKLLDELQRGQAIRLRA